MLILHDTCFTHQAFFFPRAFFALGGTADGVVSVADENDIVSGPEIAASVSSSIAAVVVVVVVDAPPTLVLPSLCATPSTSMFWASHACSSFFCR